MNANAASLRRKASDLVPAKLVAPIPAPARKPRRVGPKPASKPLWENLVPLAPGLLSIEADAARRDPCWSQPSYCRVREWLHFHARLTRHVGPRGAFPLPHLRQEAALMLAAFHIAPQMPNCRGTACSHVSSSPSATPSAAAQLDLISEVGRLIPLGPTDLIADFRARGWDAPPWLIPPQKKAPPTKRETSSVPDGAI